MSTHNICFHGEIKNVAIHFSQKSTLSGSMQVNRSDDSFQQSTIFIYFQ